MKKFPVLFFALALTVSVFALDNTIAWNGFWDTTGYNNNPETVESVAVSEASVDLSFFDSAESNSPEWFDAMVPGFLLLLR